jgi:hypothetical protein
MLMAASRSPKRQKSSPRRMGVRLPEQVIGAHHLTSHINQIVLSIVIDSAFKLTELSHADMTFLGGQFTVCRPCMSAKYF